MLTAAVGGRDAACGGGSFEDLQGAVEAALGRGRDVVPVVTAAIAAAVGVTANHELAPHVVHRVVGEMSSLWAEWSVANIPELDGARVLVLWPPILGGRHWGSDFFGPALEAAPSRVTLKRELDPAEAAAWFARLGLASGPAV